GIALSLTRVLISGANEGAVCLNWASTVLMGLHSGNTVLLPTHFFISPFLKRPILTAALSSLGSIGDIMKKITEDENLKFSKNK
ncbi:hypothetical protein, partial [Fluviispira vulneris]|uniref:hypothetical protein n=1 Tax=Fluviispira vulneris TaxID=2763012 RepID=UPI001644BD5A